MKKRDFEKDFKHRFNYFSSFPGVVQEDGIIRFQCHGKKSAFFKIALVSQIALLALHGLLSTGAIMWCLFFR